MNLKLAKIIHQSQDQIISTWVNRVQREVVDYSRRTDDELCQTIRSHLFSILDILEYDDETKLNEFIRTIAQLRSSLNFSLSSIERSFFIGKEVVCEHIKSLFDDTISEYLNHCKDIEILFLKSLFNFTDCYARIREEQVANKTRKLAEAKQSFVHYRELEKEKQKLEGILSAIGAGLSLIDSNSRVLSFNEFLTKEITPSEDNEKELCFQAHWNQNEPCENCPAKRSFETGRIERMIKMRKLDDGHVKYFQIDTIPVRNDNGKIDQVLELIQDVTDAVKLEQQFLKAERLASLGKMAAKVAHEIRNPLSSISLNTELLEDEIKSFKNGSSEEAENLLASIMSEIDRLVLFTEEYLQFYRLPQLKFEHSNINQLIRDLLDFFKHEFATHQIKVLTNLEKKLPAIKIDDKQIRQALINMLRNSIEAMPQGGQIEVSSRCNGKWIELKVSDNGCGIALENNNDIFELFFSTKSGGTGLGLPLTQQIIHGHGGTITCESELDCGTTFSIKLPLNGNTKGS